MSLPCSFFFFFFNDTATTEIYTLSLHDALPISHDIPVLLHEQGARAGRVHGDPVHAVTDLGILIGRSEEHTSELQSLAYLVCRLLLEKKKRKNNGIALGVFYVYVRTSSRNAHQD